MCSAEVNKILVARFPGLRAKYLDEISWQEGDDTGSHTVYGDVLTPYLAECILSDRKQEFVAIFDFLEELLEIGDDYVNEVVSFSVLESLSHTFKEKDYLMRYLGNRCKKILEEID